MRRKISLYIGNLLADMDEQSFVLFNYTMEELSNPTIVRNSFSKSITLPGTANNNKIFGHIYRLDRITQYGNEMTGPQFDVMRRTPFVIYNELNEVVESGYAKLDKVSKKGSQISYHITLFGGLGSFFYALMYDEQGSKLSLGSLRYKLSNGLYTSFLGNLGQVGGYEMLKDAWRYLQNPEGYDLPSADCWWADILNFAPCYNGAPDKFSADKALVDSSSFENVPSGVLGDDGKTQYSTKTGAGSLLMLFGNSHDEWEIRDLRWYLQRPVFRIKALFDAICDKENNGGYEVELSPHFFNEQNHLYWDAWMTLPLIASEERNDSNALVNLLKMTSSPIELVLSYTKMFGLIFRYDGIQKKVTIMDRQSAYSNTEIIDLTDRVDKSSIEVSPVIAKTKIYQLGGGAIGEWAEDYRVDYGEDYAIQKINTGNEFDPSTTMLTDNIIFQDAVEVQERNLLYTSNFLTRDEAGGLEEHFILPRYESVKLQLWGKESGATEQSLKEIDVTCPYEYNRYFINPSYPLSDWLPKAQFHGKDNKPIDGSNVLLIFNGCKTTPKWTAWAELEYRVSDDHPDMELLNDGVPCWNFTQTKSQKYQFLPSFRRVFVKNIMIDSSFEWGNPQARGVNGVLAQLGNPHTIYSKYWKQYLSDRYNDDTLKITCKVNLRGLNVGQTLLGRFFYYDGATFVLNKISNLSLTTWDDTECEFIKVQNIKNYIG